MPVVVKVGTGYRIVLPRVVREALSIKIGDSLLMDVQDGVIVLIPEPKRYTDYLQGLHSEIWKDVDVQKYLSGEREAWTSSSSD